MYIAGVSAMGFELYRQIDGDEDEALEQKVGRFIANLPDGTAIPGTTLEQRARWIIESAKEVSA